MNYNIVGSDTFPRKVCCQRGCRHRGTLRLKARKKCKRAEQLLRRMRFPQRAEVQRFFPLAQPRPAQAAAERDSMQVLETQVSFAATSGAARSLTDPGPGQSL